VIRIALVGCGSALDSFPSVVWRLKNATVSAVVHPNPEIGRGVVESVNALHTAESLEELLHSWGDSVDAVVIHSAIDDHAVPARLAVRAGKHVLVEAPLADSTASADDLIESAREADVMLMAGQHSRFLPEHIEVKHALDAGKLGDPSLLRIHRWEPPTGEARQAHRDDSMFLHRIVREMDLANWMFGTVPDRVYAVAHPGHADGEHVGKMAFGYFQAHLGFPDGGMAILDYCSTMPARSTYHSLSLIGSRGAAYADDHRNIHLLYGRGGPQVVCSSAGTMHLVSQLQHFVDVIHENRQSEITGADARAAIMVAETVALSIDTGHAQRLVDGGGYEPV